MHILWECVRYTLVYKIQVVDRGNKSVIIYELRKEYELEWISNYPTIFQFHKVVMNIFNLIYIIFELRE